MTDKFTPPKTYARAERKARLKQALRANLKRRKRAAKSAKAGEPSAPAADGAPPAGALRPPAGREGQS